MPTTNKKLKVGIVLDGGLAQPDGVQQYVFALGDWLESQGHEVKYITAGKIPKSVKNGYSLASNVPVRFNGNKIFIPLPARRKKVKQFLRDHDFDVLHIQCVYSPLLGGQLIALAPKQTRIVGTFHNYPNDIFSTIGSKILRILTHSGIKKFDYLMSVSLPAHDFTLKTFKIETEIVPNMFNFAKYNVKSYKNQKQPLTILFLGRLLPRKGCLDLIKAIEVLSKTSPELEYQVIIAGKGRLLPELEDYVKHNNLSQLISFIGFVPEKDKPGLLASADISVFPSTGGESFGIVLLEAMASGHSAVLAANNPGYAYVLNGTSSQLFEAGNIFNLASLIKKHLENPVLRQKTAISGQKISKKYDVNLICQQIVSKYY